MKPDLSLPPREQWHLAQLLEHLLDATIGDEQLVELNRLLRENAAAHDFAARFLHLNGSLKTLAPGMERWLQDSELLSTAKPALRLWRAEISWVIAAAACIALLTVVILPSGKTTPQVAATATTVATLTQSKNCRWAQSSLPTVPGSAIGPGYYELVEGMATFRFESGAEIVLEAPSTLEIIDALNCRLRKGALLADVPESAIGFTVDTPDATVVDYGTKFGVSAGDDGYYVVQVLDGLVEVTDKTDKQTKALNEGESISVGGLNLSQANVSSTEYRHNNRLPPPSADDGWDSISTSYGNGADTFIQLGDFTDSPSKLHDFGNHPILRVKRSDSDPKTNRKAYLRFDLREIDLKTLSQARLELTIVPAEIGFASFVPDATFTVHGLTDESQDTWNENELSWDDAPGHSPESPDFHLPSAASSTQLGTFTIPQGQNNGVVSIGGEALASFLRTDTNKLITLIICRQTDELHRGGLAHEFASRENRVSAPPLLKLLHK